MADVKEHPPTTASLYERDFALWAEEQVRLLQTGRFEELDLPNLIEEVGDLSGSQRRAIRNDLRIVLVHLLKWQFQPDKRSNSWRGSLREHRDRIEDECEDSPSLRSYPATVFSKAYGRARLQAADETGLPRATFPTTPPFTFDQALDPDFLPE